MAGHNITAVAMRAAAAEGMALKYGHAPAIPSEIVSAGGANDTAADHDRMPVSVFRERTGKRLRYHVCSVGVRFNLVLGANAYRSCFDWTLTGPSCLPAKRP
jgi:hypothetical protein